VLARRELSAISLQPADEIYQLLEGKGHKTAGLFAVITHPAILDVVESVIGPEILAHPQFNARARLPDRDEMVVPWHQDLGLLDPDAEDTFMVNFWIPLVDVSRQNGCLQVVPGSHKRGLMRHEVIDHHCLIPALEVPDDQCVTCPLRVGDALLFQHKTIHRSLPNRSGQVRWTLDLRYNDHRLPTGRDWAAGFVARSRAEPQRVARSHLDWLTLMKTSA
jgi:ectoine hydroxylase-related dioxygenase (phytanoyl-CoA dioxygenase family)